MINHPYIYRSRYASEYQPRSSFNYLNSILGNKVGIQPISCPKLISSNFKLDSLDPIAFKTSFVLFGIMGLSSLVHIRIHSIETYSVVAVTSPWFGFVLYVFHGSFSSQYLLITRILEKIISINSGIFNDSKINLKWIHTESLEGNKDINNSFKNVDGILVPGGFGDRGIEGKIISDTYARDNNIPYFAIWLFDI